MLEELGQNVWIDWWLVNEFYIQMKLQLTFGNWQVSIAQSWGILKNAFFFSFFLVFRFYFFFFLFLLLLLLFFLSIFRCYVLCFGSSTCFSWIHGLSGQVQLELLILMSPVESNLKSYVGSKQKLLFILSKWKRNFFLLLLPSPPPNSFSFFPYRNSICRIRAFVTIIFWCENVTFQVFQICNGWHRVGSW